MAHGAEHMEAVHAAIQMPKVPGGAASIAPAEGDGVRLSEVIGAMSEALDLTEGLPAGHAARTCAIGMRIGAALELAPAPRSSLFYALLMKDAGCSSNASPLAKLYGADDRMVKQAVMTVDFDSPVEKVSHVLSATAPARGPFAKARHIATLVRSGSQGARDLFTLRCERGAEIARMVDLGEETAQAIHALHEHWDGAGYPLGLAGEQIPLLGRILGLAQTMEVFVADSGLQAAVDVARARSGTWFDPALVEVFESFANDAPFWATLAGEEPEALLLGLEPDDVVQRADDPRLDRIAEAFARVIDAKSPFTFRHSEGVAEISVRIALELGYGEHAVRDLRRAALLHDIGKLGVSNRILDKQGPLDRAEWDRMRLHPAFTLRILKRVSVFRPLARVAAAHHEKLDGSGYHLGLTADQLPPAARILAVADICEALAAERPYRAALAPGEVVSIMRRDVPDKLDPEVFAALLKSMGRAPAVGVSAGAPLDGTRSL